MSAKKKKPMRQCSLRLPEDLYEALDEIAEIEYIDRSDVIRKILHESVLPNFSFNIRSYENSEPKQFGNMHERMQHLIQCAQKSGSRNMPEGIWDAIYDLETEVKNHKPINPAYGSRPGYRSPNIERKL